MSEDEYFKSGFVPPDVPKGRLNDYGQAPSEFDAPQGIAGEISSYSRRRAVDQYKKMLSSVRDAYQVGTQLNDARVAFIASQVRLGRNNLERIALEEEAKITAAYVEADLRLADANLRKKQFSVHAEKEDIKLDNELMEQKIRQKQLQEQLYGKAKSEKKPGKSKKKLVKKRDGLEAEREEMDSNFERRVSANEISNAYQTSYNQKRNRLCDEIEQLNIKIASL